jgi:hypothetical protein
VNYYNRYFSTLWGIFSIFSVAFWLLLQSRFDVSTWLEYSEGMLLLYLVYNSRSLRHKQSRALWMASGILIMGLVFKLLRFPYTFILLLVGSSAVIISYLLFYIRFTKRSILDTLKLSWVILFLSVRLINLFHFLIPTFVEQLSSVLIFSIYFWVSRLELAGKDQSEIEPKEVEMPEDIL